MLHPTQSPSIVLVAGARSQCGSTQEGKGFDSILLLTGAPCECEAFGGAD
ncbi:hypothetical protein CK203_020656 [Vitis vinifera]|uniref:Uncharacterized protein n=1 Tax=Vitis vinifera TaxID=29760 RepID=A0A438FMJ2_VITVI|nr:hypothetical protein CK203_020656 [Vitis vinifera]